MKYLDMAGNEKSNGADTMQSVVYAERSDTALINQWTWKPKVNYRNGAVQRMDGKSCTELRIEVGSY